MPFFFGILLGFCIGFVVIVLWNRRERDKYLAVAEYWVYIPDEQLPKQDEIMSLVLQGNSPVGPQEGLLFSDIRLHIALVLRSKNPRVFRPDLLADHVEPTSELLSILAKSKAVVKIRYLSEIKLKSDAHLQLLPYLAYAYSKLANGQAVLDVTAERLMTVAELQQTLKEDRNARRAEVHLQTVWQPTEDGGRVESRGLVKKGFPELVTGEIMHDEKLLATHLMEEAAKQVWAADALPSEVELERYDDRFRILIAPPRRGKSLVRILRQQTP